MTDEPTCSWDHVTRTNPDAEVCGRPAKWEVNRGEVSKGYLVCGIHKRSAEAIGERDFSYCVDDSGNLKSLGPKPSKPSKRRWDVRTVHEDGLHALLDKGWEPFAVTEEANTVRYHLRLKRQGKAS